MIIRTSTDTRTISTIDPLRILLIEDNKGDAILIAKFIEQAMPGTNSITKAMTIEEAMKQLSEHTFDVALMDRSLPDAKGFSGLFSVQNMAPKLPVVFLTAYQDEQTAFEAIQNGAQDYLFKGKTDAQAIMRAIQYAILRKEFEGVLMMRANYDMLTGLANRLVFENRLDTALAKMKRHGGDLSILFLDLDRFKQVNDSLGHAAGDHLLKEVGGRLKQSLRSYDTVARFGGDEFAILLEGGADTLPAEIVAQKIIECIQQPIELANTVAQIGVSIGIATGGAGTDRDALLKRADSAMYEAKSQSGSTYRVSTGED